MSVPPSLHCALPAPLGSFPRCRTLDAAYRVAVEAEDVRNELMPLFDRLGGELEADKVGDAVEFFQRIRSSIEAADSTDDLMAPFQELATTCFRGFEFGPESFWTVTLILDRAYAIAEVLGSEGVARH